MDTLKSLPLNYYINRAIGPEGFISHLYKYSSLRALWDNKKEPTYNENLIQSLVESYLWHSLPETFNDPYDCYDELIDYTPTEQVIEEVLRMQPVEQREILKEFKVKDPYTFSQGIIKAFKQTAIQQGICCFTKNATSNLMWSHYADSHRGVCLEFDHHI